MQEGLQKFTFLYPKLLNDIIKLKTLWILKESPPNIFPLALYYCSCIEGWPRCI